MIKKEDHNTGVSNDVEKLLMKNLIKNLKNDALSRYLIKNIEKYLSKVLKLTT